MDEKPIKILFIEDDPDFAFTLKTRLEAFKGPSFSIDCASDLAAGIKKISEGGIDVLLLDLNLKDSRGMTTLKKLNQQAKNLPIIVLTGEFDESTGPETLRLGAQDYFLKGEIHPQALTRAIRYSIERKRQEEVLRRAYAEVSQLLVLVPSVLIRIDPEDRIINWNSIAERVLGVSHDQAIHQVLSRCGVDWDYKTLSEGIAKCRETKRTLRLDDISFRRPGPGGEKAVLGVTVNPIIEEGREERVGILIYGADITERKRLEAELRARSAI